MLTRWCLKVAAQHALSHLPFGPSAEALLRRHVTRTSRTLSDEAFRFRARWAAVPYLRAMARHFGPERFGELRHLDVGAGWHPVLPLAFRSAGVGAQLLVDVEPHLEARGCEQAHERVLANLDWLRGELDGCRLDPLPPLGEPRGAGVGALIGPLGIRYQAPVDTTALGLASGSVDVVTSSGVLAYLRPPVLERLLAELVRVLKPGGLLGLYVHLVDDYKSFDPGLPAFHFLRFEEATWERLVCSRRFYNNRLRMRDYLGLFARHGLGTLASEWEDPTPEDLEALGRLPLARRFRGRAPGELGIRRFVTVLTRHG
jgi:SAM-dependent methyltransferase